MSTDQDDIVKAVAKKKVQFPSSSSSTKPTRAPKKKKSPDQVRLLGLISQGEV